MESVAFARAMGFADVHVFRYSPRRGTAASRMAQQLTPEVKRDRSEGLRAAAAEMSAAYRKRFVGSRRGVLWEEELDPDRASGRRRWTGLTDNYLRVDTFSERDLLGQTDVVKLDRMDRERFVVLGGE